MSFNTYGKITKTYGGNTPVWLGDGEILPGGGSLVAQYVIEDALYPAGTPVYLSGMGGDLTPLEVFEIQADVSTVDTSLYISAGNFGTVPLAESVYGVLPSSGTTIALSSDVSTVSSVDASGNYKLTFTAGAFGAASAGDYLVFSSEAGASKPMLAPVNGLLYNDIYFEEDITDATATGAVRVSGQILEDRIPTIPASIKALLPKITFIKEE